ncbi:unnamed protein product [Prorocentrum cordatum]|uniref:Uncharacterized protein n=1 Tax=Prorocentrum cordatum TaxID=2364126 RepID=A0ABN9SFJ9_9DINO|nr:unnamed protein product [Polarella glacialis]
MKDLREIYVYGVFSSSSSAEFRRADRMLPCSDHLLAGGGARPRAVCRAGALAVHAHAAQAEAARDGLPRRGEAQPPARRSSNDRVDLRDPVSQPARTALDRQLAIDSLKASGGRCPDSAAFRPTEGQEHDRIATE